VAVLRAIHNIQIVVPADNFETRQAILAAAESRIPIYLKFGKKSMPNLPRVEEKFEIGRASVICKGEEIAFVACGETVAPAYEAARLLEGKGIRAEVISMHTIRPLDSAAIVEVARRCKAMVTVEEHCVNGGLGEACASLLMQQRIFIPLKIVGFPDEETVTGSQTEIFNYYGISGTGLMETALKLLET
jgi:transketolase